MKNSIAHCAQCQEWFVEVGLFFTVDDNLKIICSNCNKPIAKLNIERIKEILKLVKT